MKRFRQFLTFQQPTGESRGAEGSVIVEYDNAPGLVNIPATVLRQVSEVKENLMTPTTDAYRVIVAGHHPEIQPSWIILDGVSVFDVLSAEPTIGRRSTIVIAEKVAP